MTTREQQRNLRLRFFKSANTGNSGEALAALFKRNKLKPNVIPESWTKKGPELITKSIVEGAPISSMTMHRRRRPVGAKRKVVFAAAPTCPPGAKPPRTTGEQSKNTMIRQQSGPPYFGRCKEMGRKGEGCKKKEEDPLRLGACMKTIYRDVLQPDGSTIRSFTGYEKKQDNPWYAKTADGAKCCFPTEEEANQSMLRQPIISMPTPGASMKRSDSGDSVGSHDSMLEELQIAAADEDLTIQDLRTRAHEEHPLTEEEELKIEGLRIAELERRLEALDDQSTGTAALNERGGEVWGDSGRTNPFAVGSDFSEEGDDRSLVSSRTSSFSTDDIADLRSLLSDSDSSITSEAAQEQVAEMEKELAREEEEEESEAVKKINDTISGMEQKITTSKKEIQKLKTEAKPLKKDSPERKLLMLKIKQLLTTKKQNEAYIKNQKRIRKSLIQMEKMKKALEGKSGKPKAKKEEKKKKTGWWGGSRKRKRRKNKKSTRKRRR